MYKLSQTDIVATLEIGIDTRTLEQILWVRFNGKLVATFDSGHQLRSLHPEHMGEWRKCSCREKK